MPALIPVDNTLGALFIGTVLSSMCVLLFVIQSHLLIEPDPPSSLYGVTWLQVYYYYNDHCSRDRWPLKSLVAFLMLLDTASLVFVIHEPYRDVITNFGDYESNAFKEVSCSTFSCRAHGVNFIEEGAVSTRIGSIVGFSIPASSDLRRLTGRGRYWDRLKHIHDQSSRFEVLCDVLITVGMVYYLMSHRTQFRRTNNVLNLLAIYFINCGTLHL
ncbi:hypothetical protein EDB83DRAFT_2312481 [Lactarius deliciosus]|nr:hypothetical protein EDB83DRAFT_2312481 [Lactarius deliciosus]